MDSKAMIGIAGVALLVAIGAGLYFISGSSHPAYGSTSSAATTALSTAPSTTIAGSSTSIPANSTQNASKSAYTVILESSPSYGQYLANSTGFTLYTYSSDAPNSGASACYSSCAANWPPFYTQSISVPAGLNASDFGNITRTGGAPQTTYKGYPLYFFVQDRKAGDITGQGVAGFKVATK